MHALLRTALLLALSACGIVSFPDGDDGDTSAEPLNTDVLQAMMLEGDWKTEPDDAGCGSFAFFRENHEFRMGSICIDLDANEALTQRIDGVYATLPNGQLSLDAVTSTCDESHTPSRVVLNYVVRSFARGDQLTLLGNDGAFSFTRLAPANPATESPSSGRLIYGCFTEAGFVRGPMTKLP